jgi:hypothetical protein
MGVPNSSGAQAIFGNSIASNALVAVGNGIIVQPLIGNLFFSNVGTRTYTVADQFGMGTRNIAFDNGVDGTGKPLPVSIDVEGGINAGGNHSVLTHSLIRRGADMNVIQNGYAGQLLTVNFIAMNNFPNTGDPGGNVHFSGVGDIRSGGVGGLVPPTQSITKDGPGTLSFQWLSTGTLNAIIAAPGGIFVNGGTVIARSNSQLVDLYNTLTPVNVVTGARIAGSGDFSRVAVTCAGTLSPGEASAATFPLGTVTFTGGHYAVDLASTGNDKFTLSLPDAINLGNGAASLDVNFLNGFTPAAGQAFVLAEYASGVNGTGVSGFFANAPVDGGEYLLNGQEFTIAYTYGPNHNSIALIAVPEPLALVLSSAGVLVVVFLGTRHFLQRRSYDQLLDP